jgi:hypothetical protein
MSKGIKLVKTALSLCLLGVIILPAAAQTDTSGAKEFKPSGRITGTVFGDYGYKVHSDSAKRGALDYAKTAKDNNAFEFRRIYLGYEYSFSKKISSEFLLAYENNTDLLQDNARSFYIKAANIRWNIFQRTDLVIGQMATPTFALFTEKVWGYRSGEKTIMDQRRLASSNDLGVALQGKLDKDQNFGYTLMVGNDRGPRAEDNKSKRVYGSLNAKLLDKRLLLEIYGDYESNHDLGYVRDLYTTKFFAAWQAGTLTVGIEAFQQNQQHYKTLKTGFLQEGISVFVRDTLIRNKLGVFVRYDTYDPDATEKVIGAKEHFVILGLDYTPLKNVHFMPNIWYDGYSNKFDLAQGKNAYDYDLEARITFWYNFR